MSPGRNPSRSPASTAGRVRMMRSASRRLEGLDRERDSQVRLARAGRTDAEGHDVAGDGVGVALLAGGLGPDGAALGRAKQFGGEHLGRAHVVLDHGDGPTHVAGVEALALFEERDELVEQPAHPFGVLAVDGDLVAPHHDVRAAEGLFDQPQQLVSLPEQAHHEVVSGDEDLDLGRHWRSQRGYQQVPRQPRGAVVTGVTCPDASMSSSRGPRQAPATEHVQMEMGDGVGRVLPHVEYESIPASPRRPRLRPPRAPR